MGCTTGAKIFKDEQILVVFKNKDFRVKNHSDQLSFEHSHAFGVRGVNLRSKKAAGFSIGVNRHNLVAVNSNILATSDSPYDLLTERIILEAKAVEEAIDICKEEVHGRTDYQWCNMVIATPDQLIAIELTSSELASEQSDDYMVRTNHHLILETTEAIIKADPVKDRLNIDHSVYRFNESVKTLKDASNVEDIRFLLRSHNKAAICRHGLSSFQDHSYTTVYSYFILINFGKNPKIVFNVARGPPCQSSFIKFNLEFPLTSQNNEQVKRYYPV
ncbi:MAG: hypothetical protein JSW11_08420 [Candidatus Heimdallarchaeota archaeon]|nr:MAG: hypothetical protein JSW11_08420 [Candidatus Heimdallarchaeota archaeon]